MSSNVRDRGVFDQIKAGLEDSIAHSKGELSLKTTSLPAPPPRAAARQIVALRRRLGMSQAVFAAVLNVSARTVQSWEQGTRVPADAALRMLEIIGTRPEIARSMFRGGGGMRRPRRVAKRRSVA